MNKVIVELKRNGKCIYKFIRINFLFVTVINTNIISHYNPTVRITT